MYLEEMTQREVEEYLKKSDICLIPVGSTECHGPQIPLGSDTFVAQAWAKLISDEVNGIVFPALSYGHTSTTARLKGSISISPQVMIAHLREICLRAIEQGFRRILLINVHSGNYFPLGIFAQEILEETKIPVAYVAPWSYMTKQTDIAKEIFGEKAGDGAYIEGCLNLAAIEILHKECKMRVDNVKDTPETERFEPGLKIYRKVASRGIPWLGMGFYREKPASHQPERANLSVELGQKALIRVAKEIAPIVEDLREYVKYVEKFCGEKGGF